MDIKPIRTKRDYETALKVIDALMSADHGDGAEVTQRSGDPGRMPD